MMMNLIFSGGAWKRAAFFNGSGRYFFCGTG